MQLAEVVGAKRVPRKPYSWSEYAQKHAFVERMRQEEKDRWEAYHKAREERQQRTPRHDRGDV